MKNRTEEFIELIKKYSIFVLSTDSPIEEWSVKLNQEVPEGQRDSGKLWEFYQNLRLFNHKKHLDQREDIQLELDSGFKVWLDKFREDSTNSLNNKNDEWLFLLTLSQSAFENALSNTRAGVIWDEMETEKST